MTFLLLIITFLLIAIFHLGKDMETSTLQSISIGLRPCIVGLVAAAVIVSLKDDNFYTPENPWHFYISIFLFLATLVGVKVMKINPIRMLLYSAFAGLVLLY